MPRTIAELLADVATVHPDNGLSGAAGRDDYVSWKVGEQYVTLDGMFNVDDLSAIVDHMRRHS